MDNNIKPGSFHLESVYVPQVSKVEVEAKLEKSPILIERVFPQFQKNFGSNDWTYYPCSGYDVSPSSCFNEVMYLDRDENVVRALRRAGLKAYLADVNVFNPQRKTELLILFNPHLNQVETKDLVNRINPNFILCNDYHQTAEHVQKIRNAKFKKTIEKLYHVFQF